MDTTKLDLRLFFQQAGGLGVGFSDEAIKQLEEALLHVPDAHKAEILSSILAGLTEVTEVLNSVLMEEDADLLSAFAQDDDAPIRIIH